MVELRATGEVLGNCDLFCVDEQCRRAEIGFSMKRGQRWIVGEEISDSALYGLLDQDRRTHQAA